MSDEEMANGVAAQLEDHKDELVTALNDAAHALRFAAGTAERLSLVISKVNLAQSPDEQVRQYMAVMKATKTLVAATTLAAEATTNKKKRKTSEDKAPKDPSMPKKPVTAYLMYQNKIRADIKAAHPEMTNKDLMGTIGTNWTALTEAEKKPFVEAHEKLKVAYEKELAAYKLKNPGAIPPTTAETKAATKLATESKVLKEKASKDTAKAATTAAVPKPKAGKAAAAPPPPPPVVETEEDSSDDGGGAANAAGCVHELSGGVFLVST